MFYSVYKKIRMAGSEARKMLQQRNIRLVVSVARRYQMLSSDIADLVSDGMVGLDRAIDKFDPTRGFRFSTYAHWWIRQAVMRGQTEESRVVRLDDEKLDHLIALGYLGQIIRYFYLNFLTISLPYVYSIVSKTSCCHSNMSWQSNG